MTFKQTWKKKNVYLSSMTLIFILSDFWKPHSVKILSVPKPNGVQHIRLNIKLSVNSGNNTQKNTINMQQNRQFQNFLTTFESP